MGNGTTTIYADLAFTTAAAAAASKSSFSIASYGYTGNSEATISITVLAASALPANLPSSPFSGGSPACGIQVYSPSCGDIDGANVQLKQYQAMADGNRLKLIRNMSRELQQVCK